MLTGRAPLCDQRVTDKDNDGVCDKLDECMWDAQNEKDPNTGICVIDADPFPEAAAQSQSEQNEITHVHEARPAVVTAKVHTLLETFVEYDAAVMMQAWLCVPIIVLARCMY